MKCMKAVIYAVGTTNIYRIIKSKSSTDNDMSVFCFYLRELMGDNGVD